MDSFFDNVEIRIVIADDFDVVRVGLKRLLSIDRSLRVVDEAVNGEDAIKLVRYHKPDIALLDINMPKMNGIDATKIIKNEIPDVFVVILTAFEDSHYIENALNAGADGYLYKDIGTKYLVNSLHSVVKGERVFSQSILKFLQNQYVPNRESDKQVSISPREQQILNLVANGLTSQEIADKLNISNRTVESHRYNIMQKLSVKNTAELIRFALSNYKFIDFK